MKIVFSSMLVIAAMILGVSTSANAQVVTPECERQAFQNFNVCIRGAIGPMGSDRCLEQMRQDRAVLCGTTTSGGGTPGVVSGTFNLSAWNDWFYNQWWANNGNNNGGSGDNPFNYIEWLQ